ncbi:MULTISPECIES: NAD(P)/FAD-dependent oxidoreductase [unclassified Chitinophaga]|uniref:NAD(P)/FAD-dependent oxidoreductase n=1 Tax=unclassified Chitinophaga TaxID=2619133 RepID=UPI0009CD48A4|nr:MULTISPECIES: NAD(P)/FAD-dependent oxidoreductase [unclassified Chitinophaga]OMP76661.1 flavoprotein [[Flexibacter] sp. ATCC 35208]WPV63831.1 NAD(P)/FAD-dependent oxidoreductase [Chitinophaga sp. LS1]
MKDNRLVVIGGGAAGFFCAVNAARMAKSLEVILLEKTGKLLSKVKVSGGGRCNVTHNAPDILYMSKRYPRGQHFVKKSFGHFFVPDTIQWFQERGVSLKAEPDGRMFPVTDSSQTIIDCLLKEADKHRVQIRTNTAVSGLEQTSDGWKVLLQDEAPIETKFVFVAAGGYPQADKFGWLQNTGHEIVPPLPSLFTFNMPGNPIISLMGVSAIAAVKIAGTKLQEQGPVLITHWGLSGPAILRTSAWGARELADLNYQFTAVINWLPDHNENSLREDLQSLRFELGGQKIYNKNPFGLPQRLWLFMLEQSGIAEDARWADVPSKEQNKLIKQLVAMECPVKGKTTFKEEFVTCGGIKLSEIDPNTMESKLLPQLFFGGEVMDVDGITGGFNFQHAWSSGYIAAKTIAQKMG